MSHFFKPALVLLYLLYGLEGYPQAEEKDAYVNSNHVSIDVKDTGSYRSLAIFDTAISNYKAFLIGEYHGVNGNREIEFQLLKYLYFKAGVRTIAFEFPLSSHELMNNYILYGDSSAYKQLYSILPHKPYALFFNDIFEFNKRLPLEERIKALPIDLESNWNMAIKTLKQKLPDSPAPKEIRKTIDRLMSIYLPEDILYAGHFKFAYRKLSNKLSRSMRRHEEIYRKYLAEDYYLFDRIAEGLYQDIHFPPYSNSKAKTEKREQFLFENMKDFMSKYPDDKFIGLFGKVHVSLNTVDHWVPMKKFYPLAARLNNALDSPVKERVCSMVIDSPKFDKDFLSMPKEEMSFLIKYCNRGVTIFKISGKNTPFQNRAKSFQYLIMNNL